MAPISITGIEAFFEQVTHGTIMLNTKQNCCSDIRSQQGFQQFFLLVPDDGVTQPGII